MATQRKLGKATDSRLALLKNQVSQLLWNGKLETTEARAKEVQKLAEKYITLAVNTYKDTVEVQKAKKVKGKDTTVTILNDGPQKLAVSPRRALPNTRCAPRMFAIPSLKSFSTSTRPSLTSKPKKRDSAAVTPRSTRRMPVAATAPRWLSLWCCKDRSLITFDAEGCRKRISACDSLLSFAARAVSLSGGGSPPHITYRIHVYVHPPPFADIQSTTVKLTFPVNCVKLHLSAPTRPCHGESPFFGDKA